MVDSKALKDLASLGPSPFFFFLLFLLAADLTLFLSLLMCAVESGELPSAKDLSRCEQLLKYVDSLGQFNHFRLLSFG